jgi:hypothetical protein
MYSSYVDVIPAPRISPKSFPACSIVHFGFCHSLLQCQSFSLHSTRAAVGLFLQPLGHPWATSARAAFFRASIATSQAAGLGGQGRIAVFYLAGRCRCFARSLARSIGDRLSSIRGPAGQVNKPKGVSARQIGIGING